MYCIKSDELGEMHSIHTYIYIHTWINSQALYCAKRAFEFFPDSLNVFMCQSVIFWRESMNLKIYSSFMKNFSGLQNA